MPTSSPTARHYLWLPLMMLLASLLALQATRLGMIFMYRDYFAELSIWQLGSALGLGLRFDLATVSICGSIIWLLLAIPSQALQKPRWRQTLCALYGLLLLLLLFICIGDLYYFGEVNRHAGKDLLNASADLAAIWQIIWQSLKLFSAIGLACIGVCAWLWWRVLQRAAARASYVPSSAIGKTLTFLALLVLLVLCGRGLFIQSKPIAIVDAFALRNPALANLALNGAFTVMKDSYRSPQTAVQLLSAPQLQALDQAYLQQTQTAKMRQILGANSAKFAPIFTWQQQLYKAKPLNLKRKNIVVILLESWSYQFIDALGKRGYQATPFMDQLVAKAQVWDNFYAAGQRSILGVQATFASLPVLHNQPTLGYGLERNRISQLGSIAKAEGYQTLFMQTSAKRSFHLDGIAQLLGFEQIYGKEDFPIIKKYPPTADPPFGWDYDGLMFLHAKLDAASAKHPERPFFASLFTGTTHLPFADPGPQFHLRPHSSNSFDGFLNTLRYSDWAIEQFMQAAQQSTWYKDTVFIFLADHVYHATASAAKDLKNLFHIPLIIFAADGSLPPKRHQEVASQYDLLPSFLDLMQAPQPISAYGRSLFDDLPTRPKFVNATQGNLYAVLSAHGWASFSGSNDVAAKLAPQFDQATANSYMQLSRWRLEHADSALRANNWLPTALQLRAAKAKAP